MSALSSFLFTANPARVLFGAGKLDCLASEVDRLGAKRVLVLCTPNQRKQAESIAAQLSERCAGMFDQAAMHVPSHIVSQALERAQQLSADCVVAFGGGSTIGLGKGMALHSNVPIIAIPTTYAGSEMTPIYGVTDNALKKTGNDLRVLPKTVIYDPHLTLGLPLAVSVTSAINAIAHAAEGMYAKDTNPIMCVLASDGIAALAESLPKLTLDSADIVGRTQALYGAWLCGTVLGHLGMSLHHKLCHTLGGSFDLPHSETHTVVLPHVLAYNSSSAPDAMRRIAAALKCSDAAIGVFELAKNNGAPTSLRELGMKESDLDRAADIAMATPYWNPRPLERSAIRALLQHAFEGVVPSAKDRGHPYP